MKTNCYKVAGWPEGSIHSSDLGHSGPRTLQHQCRIVRNTSSALVQKLTGAEVSGHFGISLRKVVLNLRISQLLVFLFSFVVKIQLQP